MTTPTFIYGTVADDGGIVSGTGFQVVKGGATGLWDILFSSAFNTSPAVTAIQVSGGLDNSAQNSLNNSVVTYIDSFKFQILTGDNHGESTWRGFSFIAAGS
jgi:hypothetical protein